MQAKYRIRYDEETKAELEMAYEIYGSRFKGEFTEWLELIATAAANPQDTNTLDLLEVLENAENWKEDVRLSFQELCKTNLLGKIRALLSIVRRRKPPWQLRTVWQFFRIVDSFTCEVHAYFIVSHSERTVTFYLIEGLPGQCDE